MLLNPNVTLVALDSECTKKISEPVKIWEGSGRRAPEGPHIIKKNGYYNLITAEGGTGYTHCICSGRSKNLYGPYESNPYNPLMTQTNPDAKIQRSGHGKLVETQKGDWWVLYLCGQPIQGKYCSLGRETALDPVEWTPDGWIIINKSKGPSEIQNIPDLPEFKVNENNFYDFNEDKLNFDWQFVRNPDNNSWSLTERKGFLRIKTGDYDLNSIKSKNIILRRESHHKYCASIKMEFSPEKQNEEAGITCYYDSKTYIKFCLVFDNKLKIRLTENSGKNISIINELTDIKKGEIFLKVKVIDLTREFYASYDNKNWIKAGIVKNATFLSDEGFDDKKRFTGTMVGMFAYNGGSGRRVNADFDWFEYIPQGNN